MILKSAFAVLFTVFCSLNLLAAPNKIFLKINEVDKEFYKENLGKLGFDIPFFNSLKRHQFLLPEVGSLEAPFQAAEIETRGQGCLVAFRKCLGVDLAGKMTLNGQTFEKFDLVSMREDKGYTDTQLGMTLFQYMGMFPLKFDYAELLINNANWGLYSVVEAPNFYFKKELKTPFAGRAHGIFYKFQSRYYDEKHAKNTEAEFLAILKGLVKIAKKNHSDGDTLYNLLKERMDIDQYLTLIGVQNLLKNGDYSDEIYFYVDPDLYAHGKIYFKVMIWDTDVLFRKPHPTPYNMLWKKRIEKTLFYSMENKFDRKLAKDEFINKKMASLLKDVLLNKLTEQKLGELVGKVTENVTPYLTTSTLAASIYDFKAKERSTPYSASEVLNLLKDKEKQLLSRRAELLNKAELMLQDE